MENNTLEQVGEEEKKYSKKDIFLGLIYAALGLGSFWVMIEGMEYLQIKTFSTADSITTTTNLSFLFKIMMLCLSLIIPTVCEFIFINRLKLTVKQYLKRISLIVIPSIPIMYLSFYSYLDIGAHSITYDRFWPGKKKIYIWEDIESVVIDKARSSDKKFDYYVNLRDGTSLDIWGDTRMDIEELKQVDDTIREKGIPKYINEPPYEKGLKSAYGENPKKYKMVQQVISQ